MTTTEQGPSRHLHDLLLHSSDEELAAAAGRFLRAGLDAGEVAVIATEARSARLLHDAVGDHERLLVLAPDEACPGRPPETIIALRRLTERWCGDEPRHVRLVGRTDFGATPRE